MALAVLLLLGGTVVLAAGADAALRGATRLARAHRVTPFVLGALLFGVDPESLGASVIASARGEGSIAAGGAFGTIVFLFSAAFGIALLVSRRPVDAPSHTMILLPLLGFVAGALALSDRFVSRVEGLALMVVYGLYVSRVIREGRAAREHGRELERDSAEPARLPWPLLLAAGLALVYLGAWVMVEGGVRLLERTDLSAGFVGAAVIGALASADEVFLEVLPMRRGLPTLAVGNLLGTAAAFSSGILGLAAVVRPLDVDSAATSAFIAAAALYTVVAVWFLVRGRGRRVLGLVVLAGYVSWLAFAAGI